MAEILYNFQMRFTIKSHIGLPHRFLRRQSMLPTKSSSKIIIINKIISIMIILIIILLGGFSSDI